MRGIEYFIKNNTTGEITTNTDYKTLNNFKKNAKGYAIGRIGVSDSVPTPMPTVAAVEEVNANDVKTTVYEVKVENGLLQINKCVGDNKTAILSEEISENVFPSEDIDELKKGVEFDNLDEAQQMFENFVS